MQRPVSPTSLLIVCGLLISFSAIVGSFATYRFQRAGQWFPSVPDRFGTWDSSDRQVSSDLLKGLGNPQALEKIYKTPFGEWVIASVMTAGPFENYHDPMVCIAGGGGFSMTAKKTFPIDGPGSGNVRAMIFKRRDSVPGREIRMLMYYWQQNRDGSTDTAARMGNYRDIQARFDTGFGAVVKGHQTVLMRIYTYIMPDDTNGEQAQRNVQEVSRTLYHHLRREGGNVQ